MSTPENPRPAFGAATGSATGCPYRYMNIGRGLHDMWTNREVSPWSADFQTCQELNRLANEVAALQMQVEKAKMILESALEWGIRSRAFDAHMCNVTEFNAKKFMESPNHALSQQPSDNHAGNEKPTPAA